MRIAILICCILALAMLALMELSYIGLSYEGGISSEVSVTGIDNGVIIQNVGNHPCLVIVNSPEGEQQFKLAVGANVTLVTLSHITNLINVMTLGSRIIRLDLEQTEQMEKPIGWPGTTYNLSSNITDPWSG
jgi:hypothetical protein